MRNQWVVLKFGGSSVADPGHWQTIVKVLQKRQEQGLKPLLVLSALKNVSNALEAILHQSLAGVHPHAIEQLKELHLGFASKLGLELDQTLAPWFEQLERLCDEIAQSQQISPARHAQVLAIGELLSTTIGTAYLTRQGLSTHWLDARQVLQSTNHLDQWHHFTSAECDYSYDGELAAQLEPLADVIVTQGFIAADDDQQTVLLGREGSDTSAAYFGAKLNATRIEIWTDVPGVFTANPREISQARQLPQLSFQQAQQLARLGAKVLHPRAIQPAADNQIPVWVKSTSLPDATGSIISDHAQADEHHPIAMMVEAKVSYLCIALEHLDTGEKASDGGSQLTQSSLEPLLSLGFDQIAHFEQSQHAHYILHYSNSDVAPPSDQSICDNYLQKSCLFKSNLGLISLIGLDDGRHRTVLDLLTRHNLPFEQIYDRQNERLISVLLDESLTTSASRLLHAEFIEACRSNRFGPSWQDYIGQDKRN